MPGRILVVDDELQIRRALDRALKARGYTVEAVPDGEGALVAARVFRPDLVVLDLNLPGISGLEVCSRLRSAGGVPILILSVRSDEPDKVKALDLGADDYLTKPFGIDELLARVRALLRRNSGSGPDLPAGIYRLDDLAIDLDRLSLSRAGKEIRLTKTEWALLSALARHPGRLLTHRWLLEEVWGAGYGENIEVLRVFVSQLRKKIEPDPSRAAVIVTDPGIGYRWVLRPADEAMAPNLANAT